MNICFLCRTYHQMRGGMESYVHGMAQELCHQGHVVHIVTQKGEKNFYLEAPPETLHIHEVDFREEPFRGYWRLDHFFPLTNLRYAYCLLKKVREIQAAYSLDLIETPDGYAEAFWLTLQKKIPVVYRFHGHRGFVQRYYNGTLCRHLREKLLWYLERIIISRASKVVVVSQDFSRIVKKVFNCKEKNIETIYTLVDSDFYRPDTQATRDLSVLYVGRLEENKGIGVLAEIIPSVIRDFPEVKFVFAGADAFDQNLKMTWKEYLLKRLPRGNLLFLGILSPDKLVRYYQKAAVCIIPSLYEPGSTVALEAMACGCPVIASDVGGFKEFIRHDKDGLLVPAGDIDAFAEAITRVLGDPLLKKKISTGAEAKIKRCFSPSIITQKAIESFKQAVENFSNNK